MCRTTFGDDEVVVTGDRDGVMISVYLCGGARLKLLVGLD